MDRRAFLHRAALAAGGLASGSAIRGHLRAEEAPMEEHQVMTVTGPARPESLGVTLPHEHVLVDFIGAEKVSPDRYDVDEAFDAILPHLQQVKSLGCQSFVECTPAYIGRDAALVKRLSEATGLKMLTNTGYYGAANDRFVPAHAYEESADELCRRWVGEWEGGIDGTGVRPGFIKIGVDKGPLSAIDRKLVQAAARTHRITGLTIASHTGYGVPAHEQLELLRGERVQGSAWIWVHAQNEADNGLHEAAAEQGAWLEFDGIRPKSLEMHVGHVVEMKRRGLLDRVMVSHDAGWYRPGEPGGGRFRSFELLFTTFLPALREAGFSEREIRKLTVENPARAFSVSVRAL